MKSALAPGAKATTVDLKRSLLETFALNQKANELLVANVSDAVWQAPPPTGKGRMIAAVACHIHNVRLMWLAAADKNAELPPKVDDEKARRDEKTARKRTGRCRRKGTELPPRCGHIYRLFDRPRRASPGADWHAGAATRARGSGESRFRALGMGHVVDRVRFHALGNVVF